MQQIYHLPSVLSVLCLHYFSLIILGNMKYSMQNIMTLTIIYKDLQARHGSSVQVWILLTMYNFVNVTNN